MRIVIKKYLQEKGRAVQNEIDTELNSQRETFFNTILMYLNAGQLTATQLTHYLTNLKSDELKLILNNNPASEEAELIVYIYSCLGIEVSKQLLSRIINGNLSEEDKIKLQTPYYSLSKYIADKSFKVQKKKSDTINTAKRDFFDKLLQNNPLTVSSLTDELAALDDGKRGAIFHRGRPFSSNTESGAAKQIEQLYAQLGVTLSKQDLQRIVHGGLNNEFCNQKTYADKLKEAPYQQWRHQPYSKSARKALEHELKARLSLNSKQAALMTLAEAIAGTIKEDKDLKNLATYFDQIHQHAPEFLSDVITDLSIYYQQLGYQSYFAFIAEMAALAINKDTSAGIKKALLKNPDIATAIIAGDHTRSPCLPMFFELSPGMQREVHRRLLAMPQHEKSASELSLLVANIMVRACSDPGEEKPAIEIDTALNLVRNAKAVAENDQHEDRSHLTWLIHSIFHRINEPKNYPLIHREKALGRIQRYLNTNPSEFKRNFFQAFFKYIEAEGLNVEILDRFIQGTENAKLFKVSAPFLERTDCGAAVCIFDLYELAAGVALNEEQKKHVVTAERNRFPQQQSNNAKSPEEQLKEKIQPALAHPEQAMQSLLGREILAVVEELRTLSDVLARDARETELLEEARRQEVIFNYAITQVPLQLIRFDPQGHALLEVIITNTVEDRKIKKTIFCSIDMLGIENLEKQFANTLKNQDEIGSADLIKTKDSISVMTAIEPQEILNNAVDAFVASDSRGSVIPLQEEAEFHMRLLSRVIETLDEDNVITAKQWITIRLRTAKLLEFRVKYIFQQALVEAYDEEGKTIDIAKLNKQLDKAREDLSDYCQEALFQTIGSSTDGIGENAFSILYHQKIKGNLTRKHFASTTATGEEYLRTNNRNGTITRMTATGNTAHDKRTGQAFRVVHRNRLAPNSKGQIVVTPHRHATTEARVPSIAVKEMSHDASVQDVAEKLAENYKALQSHELTRGPMVYNLLTSFVSKPAEWFTLGFWTPPHRKNRQRLSAARILKGSHIFNRKQVLAGHVYALCYVQNIPVNQHGETLSYDSRDSIRREALLMSDMAILSTLSHHAAHLPPMLRDTDCNPFEATHRLYTSFLSRQRMGNCYFNESIEGKDAIELMKRIKSAGGRACESMPVEEHETLESLVTKALFKMLTTEYQTKKYCWSSKYRSTQEDPRFGTLIQSLSVFLEPMSLVGCKSANERYAMVAGRVEVLKSISERSVEGLSIKEQDLIIALKQYITGDTTHCKELQKALDEAYNQHNLQGSAVTMSLEDQGGPSKVEATNNKQDPGEVSEIDNNVSESGYLKNLSQSKSSKMQSHKGVHERALSSLFRAFPEIKRSKGLEKTNSGENKTEQVFV